MIAIRQTDPSTCVVDPRYRNHVPQEWVEIRNFRKGHRFFQLRSDWEEARDHEKWTTDGHPSQYPKFYSMTTQWQDGEELDEDGRRIIQFRFTNQWNREAPVAIGDRSGRWPHLTDDGTLWVDPFGKVEEFSSLDMRVDGRFSVPLIRRARKGIRFQRVSTVCDALETSFVIEEIMERSGPRYFSRDGGVCHPKDEYAHTVNCMRNWMEKEERKELQDHTIVASRMAAATTWNPESILDDWAGFPERDPGS